MKAVLENLNGDVRLKLTAETEAEAEFLREAWHNDLRCTSIGLYTEEGRLADLTARPFPDEPTPDELPEGEGLTNPASIEPCPQ